jgi:Domain of unknown function DUF11
MNWVYLVDQDFVLNARAVSRQRTNSFLSLLLSVLAFFPILVAVSPPASAAARGAVLLRRVTPTPVLTGKDINYDLFYSCGAVLDPTCVNSKIDIDVPSYVELTAASHPYIQSISRTASGYTIQLSPSIPAGSSSRFKLTLLAVNGTTPTSTFSVVANLSFDNGPNATSTATGAVTASTNIAITKTVEGNAIINQVVRYALRTCNTAGQDPRFGQLNLATGRFVDVLPTGAVYVASSGGTFDGTRTVTWTGLTNLGAGNCNAQAAAEAWVDVRFPSPTFVDTQTVINHAEVIGYPYTQPANQITATTDLNHGFLRSTPTGNLNKYMSTNPYSFCNFCPYTGQFYQDDRTEAYWVLSMNNTSAVPAEFDVVDMMPCVERPGGWRYYHSAPGEGCPTPMFVTETMRIDPTIDPGDNLEWVRSTPSAKLAMENAYRAGWRPTYLTAAGNTGIFESIDGVTFVPVGLLAGERIAEVTLPQDSRFLLPALSNLTVGLGGYVPADIPADAYGIDAYNGYRYRMFSGSTEVVNTSYEFLNRMRPRRSTIDIGALTRQNDTSYEMLIHNWSGEYIPMVQAVLLAPGIHVTGPVVPYTTEGTAQPGNIPAGDAFTTEIIDNFAGTGQTLVRMMTKPGFTVAPNSQITTAFLTTSRQTMYPNRNGTDTHWAMVPGRDVQTCSYTPELPAYSYIRRYSFIGRLSTTDPLDADGDGRTTQSSCQWDRADNYWAPPDPTVASLRTISYVKGDLDPTEVASPNVATISDGGHADFRVDVQNLGTALTNAVVYDVLPSVNDTGTLNTAPRGSVFRPSLAGPLVLNDPAATAEYSTSANPCRPDIGVTTSCANDWTATPATWGEVRAYRVTYPTLAKVSTTAIRFTLNAPVGIGPGDTAWNNVVVTALDGTTQLLPAESPKVGMARPLTDISLAISLSEPNGLAGQARTVTVAVKHDTMVTTSPSGLLTYSSPAISTARGVRAAVTLPAGLQIVPGSSSDIAFNESTQIWAVGDVFVDSQQTVTFQVTAASVASFIIGAEITANAVTDIDSTPNDCGTTTGQDDCARTTLTTSLPQIALQTQVESTSGSGVFLNANSAGGPTGQYTSGQPIRYRFVLNNTGVFALSNLVLTQPELAGLCDLTVTGTLVAGASRTIDCVWPLGRGIGTHITSASVTGSINGVAANATDDATVVVTPPIAVPVPGLTVDVTVTNPMASPVVSNDNVSVRPGDPLEWKYVITNSGSDILLGFLLTDQNGDHPDLASCVRSDGLSIDDPFLPGVQATCTYPFNAQDGGESQTITANLVASSTLETIDVSDSTAYLAGTPGLAVSFKVFNPRTGLFIEADDSDNMRAIYSYGDAVQWQLTVVNTGPVNIPDIEIGSSYSANCVRTSIVLAPGDSFVLSCNSTANAAIQESGYAYSNSVGLFESDIARIRLNSSVAMQVLVADGPTSTSYIDSTPVYAAGQYSPGDTVKWRVVVTNDGEIELTGLRVYSGDFPACTQVLASLAVGASRTIDCTSTEWIAKNGYASVNTNENVGASDYAAIAMSGPDPADSLVVHLDVQDRSGTWQSGGDYNFLTSQYDVTPAFLGTDTVRWRVRVDNPGAVDIADVKIEYTGIAACNQTIALMAAGGHAEFECTSNATQTSRYAYIYAHGHYLSYDVASIDVVSVAIAATVKSPPATEGENPAVDLGAPISWHVVITNVSSSLTALIDLTLEDQFGTSYPLSGCTVFGAPFIDTLGRYNSLDCDIAATALAGGEVRTFTVKATGIQALRLPNLGSGIGRKPEGVPTCSG